MNRIPHQRLLHVVRTGEVRAGSHLGLDSVFGLDEIGDAIAVVAARTKVKAVVRIRGWRRDPPDGARARRGSVVQIELDSGRRPRGRFFRGRNQAGIEFRLIEAWRPGE